MNKTCLVMLAHGSRKPGWRTPFERLLQRLRKETGERRIYLAFMESSRPFLPEIARRVVREGVTEIRVLPLFMSSGNHLFKDIPAQNRRLTRAYRGLKIRMLPPIGSHPRFMDLMFELAKEYIVAGNKPRGQATKPNRIFPMGGSA